MARKRGIRSPLGNAVGAQDAIESGQKSNIESLAKQLKAEITGSKLSLMDVLQTHLGISNVGESVSWKLKSGKIAQFVPITLSYQQVKELTSVTFEVNGRDQSGLTKESLQDLDSLCIQQYYPAIGRRVNGVIDLLDGSRRRARFLLEAGKINSFKILVTDDDISSGDAKALAKQLQVSKEHNLREIGMRCQLESQLYEKKYNKKLTQSELAEEMGLSQAKVSKALTAASIDSAIIELFPDISLLSHSDYKVLNTVQKTLGENVNEFIKDIESNIINLNSELVQDDYKEAVLKIVTDAIKTYKPKPTEQAIVTPLANFSKKNTYARKRVKGRKFAYEFSQLTKEVQDTLDQAIAKVLQDSL